MNRMSRLIFFHENYILGGDTFYLRDLLSEVESGNYFLLCGGCSEVKALFAESLPPERVYCFNSFSLDWFYDWIRKHVRVRLVRSLLFHTFQLLSPILHLALRWRLRRLIRKYCSADDRLVINAGSFQGNYVQRILYSLCPPDTFCLLHNHIPEKILEDKTFKNQVTNAIAGWVVGSQVVARQLTEGCEVSPTSVHFIPYGVKFSRSPEKMDRLAIRKKLRLQHDEFVVVHPSIFEQRKGHLFTLRGFHALLKVNPTAKLLLVGDGGDYRTAVEAEIKRLKIEDQVVFIGFYQPLEELLIAADVVCLPSQEFDTTPLSILMAFGCEIPVITTDREDFRGVVENGRDAALVPVGDHEQIGKMLTRLQRDKKLRQDLAQNAKNVWKTHFDLDRMVKKTWDILLQAKKCPL